MDKPTKYELDGTTTKIEWDAKLGRVGKFPKAGDLYQGRLRVSLGMTPTSRRGTVLHETLHDCWHRAGLDKFYGETTEETIIAGLDSWVLELFTKNPALRDYIFNEGG